LMAPFSPIRPRSKTNSRRSDGQAGG
jgi:hypothetical protein